MIEKEGFTFDDVLIVPKFSTIESRKEVDLSVSTHNRAFSGFDAFGLPVISANMDTVTGPEMSRAMLKYGAQACVHRFSSIEDSVKLFEASFLEEDDTIARPMVSIGLGLEELERARALYGYGATKFVIDVAHGAQKSVGDQVKALREIIKDNGAIMVGNFASSDSVGNFLEYTGRIIDGVKIGVGPGSSCTTRVKTGVGYPQLSAVYEIYRLLKNTGIAVIADGGMKTPGDIAKALGAGASFVMLGGMLAGTDETPGSVVYKDPQGNEYLNPLLTDQVLRKFKKYRGSASQESYEAQGKTGTHRTSEGESFLVPYKGPVSKILQDIEGGLRSSFTYVGARNLKEYHSKVEFVRISSATQTENRAHGAK